MQDMQRRLLIAALAAFLALPAVALAATKPVPVTLSGVLFNDKPNAKLTLKLGGSLRFVWKEGFHNVLTQKAPSGARKVNTGKATEAHKPVVFTPTKKGKYVLYCEPHRALGMVLTLTVK
jgi:plastocyanin